MFASTPAVLVAIDGDPAWRPIVVTSYERFLNKLTLLLREGAGTIYFGIYK